MQWIAPTEKDSGSETLERRLWRQKAQARAQVRIAIEDTLDEGLPRAYTLDVFQQKCGMVFAHVFEIFGDTGEVEATA